jgi:ribonucleotide reductase alpha subunit
MRVIKRNGEFENVSFDKVLNRLKYLSDDIQIDICEIAQKVCGRIYDGVHTTDLDELAAHLCSSLIVVHPDYGRLASKIIISNHHKNTSPSFSETIHILYHNPTGPLVSKELYDIVQQHKEKLNSYIDYSRDYCFDYFGFKTLERSYLLKSGGKIVERPQHMWMRVSLGIHKKDIREALQTYDLMSQKYFTHATPTLFNSGTPRPQNSSCFLLSMRDDSIAGIYDSLKDVALISKYAGGIGIHMHQIRAKGSVIRGNNGISSGIVPMLRVFNNTARYVDQAGKRLGSIAVYLEPHHADIEQFLELRKNHGNEEERCRDLFLALWVPDLFMERVRDNSLWSLMCPDQCPGLSGVWGEEFNNLYTSYEQQGRFVKQVKAQDLWFKILESQIETGVPYICYKDAANRKSNQQNLGTIKSSNLCVAPDTMILTSDGYFPIGALRDKNIRVWNGHDFSETVVRQTGKQQKLVRIAFSNGMEIRCTPYHKFYLKDAHSFVARDPVDAKDLLVGDVLINYQLPTIKTSVPSLEQFEDTTDYIPINRSLDIKLAWLSGCLNVVGCVENNSIKATFPDKEFATHVFYMLQTMGVHPSLQTDETNTHHYDLWIPGKGVRHLCSLGFSSTKLELSDIQEEEERNTEIHVVQIDDLNETDDTYCFNEPHRHMGIFNGIITGQCVEIHQYSSPDEISTCNLASVCLPTYVEKGVFHFEKLHEITKVIIKNINKVIDGNFYPLEEAQRSNFKHRPTGLGIQGFSDVLMMLKIPFESAEARELNKQIFETMYHGALECSMEIAKKRHLSIQNNEPLEMMNEYEPLPTSKYPGAYSSFEGSPVSKGILQYDMWGVQPSDRYDWNHLKEEIQKYGIRNSLLLAPMPTASTAQIMGFNESFEPITSNIYKRKTLSGEFIVVNKYLIQDLIDLGLWSTEMKDRILLNDGSVQNIDEIPTELKELYKTVWEIKQKTLIDLSADRGAFICQSQSLNIFIEDPDFKKLTSMHFYGWSKGLKTGSYYIRTKPKAKTQQFTIDPNFAKQQQKKTVVCTDEVCTMCSA